MPFASFIAINSIKMESDAIEHPWELRPGKVCLHNGKKKSQSELHHMLSMQSMWISGTLHLDGKFSPSLSLWHNQHPEKRALPRKTASFSLQIQSSRLESDTLIIMQLGLRRFVIRQRLIRKCVTNSEEGGIPGRQRCLWPTGNRGRG